MSTILAMLAYYSQVTNVPWSRVGICARGLDNYGPSHDLGPSHGNLVRQATPGLLHRLVVKIGKTETPL
jgi:hypothetical protein